jgi:hypothetical protein
VLITGLEAEAAHTLTFGEVSVPVAATYTWTWSRFVTEFESPNPQLGSVQIGYRLPYVAEHQLGLRGVSGGSSRCTRRARPPMRDVAGPGSRRRGRIVVRGGRASLEVIRNLRSGARGRI